MKSKLNVLATLAALSSLAVPAYAQQCEPGYVPVSLRGHTRTMNVSATRQAGQICLVMTRADGREIFDDCGALVGNITAQDLQTGSSTLNHTAVFDLTQSFRTEGDVSQITSVLETEADGAPCAFSVVEQITRLKWGTGLFAGATIASVAEGTISFCPGKNLNTFELSGQACVRRR